MADLSSLMKPLTNASSGISNILGSNNDYSSLSQLLHIHMKMLDNISNKIDVVMKGIVFIIENQLEYIKVLKNIPEDTVAELYKSDLEGLFLLINEKIEAYAIEKENGTLTKKKKELIFDEILIELQMARAKLLTIDNYLNLPLVSTCLHFELFCMYLAEQPNSYIKTTLNSYKKWIKRQIDTSVKKYYDDAKFEQAKNIKSVLNDYTYTHCMKSEIRNDGEPGIPGSTRYTIDFYKYNYYLESILSKEDFEQIKHLIERNYIKIDEVPSKLFFKTIPDDSGLYNFTISDGFGPHQSKHTVDKKIKIKEDFYIFNNHNTLKASSFDCTDPKFNSIILENNSDVIKLSTLINDNYYKLVIYASLLNCAEETFALIDKWISNSNNFSEFTIYDLTIKNEYLTRINNERLKTWIDFLNEKDNELLTIEKRERLIAIKAEMQKISDEKKIILSEYSKLEEELSNILPNNLFSEIGKLLSDIGRELEIGVQNVVREHDRFVSDLGRNLEKAVQDIGKETERTGQNIGDLVQAVEGFVENEIKAFGKNLSEAEKRVREGKMIDALWHMGIDPLKSSEDNAAKAFQESSLLTSIASAAASIYGVPYGGAAFAAWLTYKQTGSLEAALKTAVITYLTQEANATAKSIQGVEISDIAKRTLITSATGAAAIAASGGGEKQIIDGFLKGAALTLANETYKNTARLDIEGKPPKYLTPYNKEGIIAEETFYDKTEFTLLDKDGNHVIDITKLSRDVTHVGIAAKGIFATENAIPMKFLSQIPFVNDMAYYHDQLCAIYDIGGINVQTTLIPATMLTIAGSDRPIMEQIIEVVTENAKE